LPRLSFAQWSNDHACQFFLGDQLERDRHHHGAGQQFFHAFLAQSFTKAPQLGGVARPLLLEILIARKVLPGGNLAPALNDIFIALVEGVLKVHQRNH
jgi:hypothetical protein